jgi:hypothetical protein
MVPCSYFYVIDTATHRPLAIFPAEPCAPGELEAYEDQLRIQHGVDGKRLALKSSHTEPLSSETLRRVLLMMGSFEVQPAAAPTEANPAEDYSSAGRLACAAP